VSYRGGGFNTHLECFVVVVVLEDEARVAVVAPLCLVDGLADVAYSGGVEDAAQAGLGGHLRSMHRAGL
jgi:hypothetical protein